MWSLLCEISHLVMTKQGKEGEHVGDVTKLYSCADRTVYRVEVMDAAYQVAIYPGRPGFRIRCFETGAKMSGPRLEYAIAVALFRRHNFIS